MRAQCDQASSFDVFEGCKCSLAIVRGCSHISRGWQIVKVTEQHKVSNIREKGLQAPHEEN